MVSLTNSLLWISIYKSSIMRIISITTFLFTILSFTLLAQEEQFSKESILQEFLNTTEISEAQFYPEDLLIAQRNDRFDIGTFTQLDSLEYYYNENDKLSSVLFLFWDGIAWNESRRETRTYDTNGNITNILIEVIVDGEWTNDALFTQEYDANNNIRFGLTENWEDDEWVPQRKFEYIYNDQNLLAEYTRFSFDEMWDPSFNYSYTYNSDGLKIFELTKIWGGTEWVNSRREESFYDENDNLIEADRREWDDPNWIPSFKFTRGYSEDNILNKQTFFRAVEGEYENWINYCAKLNQDGTIDEILFTEWIENEWVNDAMENFLYDERENRTYRIRHSWDVANSTWQEFTQNFYYYKIVSGNKSPFQNISNIEIFPNPNNGEFTLHLDDNNINQVQLYVFNCSGQLVYQSKTIDKTNELNLSHIPNGSYFLRIVSDEYSIVEKILIQQ